MDPSRQYQSGELPSSAWNTLDGDVIEFNGQTVRVRDNRNNTRSFTPLSQGELSSRNAEQATNNALASAAKIRDFNIQSNQPAIQSYQASKAPLEERYKNLLDTIKGNQGVAENRQTTATNNELGKRGFSNDSGVYQQEMSNALNPVTQGFTGQYKDALANQNIDMSAIDRAIAQLQAGDPSSAVSAGLNIGQQEQSARQFQQDYALKQALQQFQMNQPKQQEDRYATLGEGQTLFDLLNGNPVYTNPKTYKPSGGGSSGW